MPEPTSSQNNDHEIGSAKNSNLVNKYFDKMCGAVRKIDEPNKMTAYATVVATLIALASFGISIFSLEVARTQRAIFYNSLYTKQVDVLPQLISKRMSALILLSDTVENYNFKNRADLRLQMSEYYVFTESAKIAFPKEVAAEFDRWLGDINDIYVDVERIADKNGKVEKLSDPDKTELDNIDDRLVHKFDLGKSIFCLMNQLREEHNIDGNEFEVCVSR